MQLFLEIILFSENFVIYVKDRVLFSMVESNLWYIKTANKKVKKVKMIGFIKTCDQCPHKLSLATFHFTDWMQKQPPRDVLSKRCFENIHKFTGEHPCRSVISIKLLCNFYDWWWWEPEGEFCLGGRVKLTRFNFLTRFSSYLNIINLKIPAKHCGDKLPVV